MQSDTYLEQRAKHMPGRPNAVKASTIDLDNERPFASLSTISPTKLMILSEQHVNLEHWHQWLRHYAFDILGAGFDSLIAGTHAEYLVKRSKFIDASRPTSFQPCEEVMLVEISMTYGSEWLSTLLYLTV